MIQRSSYCNSGPSTYYTTRLLFPHIIYLRKKKCGIYEFSGVLHPCHFIVPHHLASYLWILVYFQVRVSVFALCIVCSLCYATCGACDVSRKRKTVLNSSSRLYLYIIFNDCSHIPIYIYKPCTYLYHAYKLLNVRELWQVQIARYITTYASSKG